MPRKRYSDTSDMFPATGEGSAAAASAGAVRAAADRARTDLCIEISLGVLKSGWWPTAIAPPVPTDKTLFRWGVFFEKAMRALVWCVARRARTALVLPF